MCALAIYALKNAKAPTSHLLVYSCHGSYQIVHKCTCALAIQTEPVHQNHTQAPPSPRLVHSCYNRYQKVPKYTCAPAMQAPRCTKTMRHCATAAVKQTQVRTGNTTARRRKHPGPLTSVSVLLQQLLHGFSLQPRKVSCNIVQGGAAHVGHCCCVLLRRDVIAAAPEGVPQLAIPATYNEHKHSAQWPEPEMIRRSCARAHCSTSHHSLAQPSAANNTTYIAALNSVVQKNSARIQVCAQVHQHHICAQLPKRAHQVVPYAAVCSTRSSMPDLFDTSSTDTWRARSSRHSESHTDSSCLPAKHTQRAKDSNSNERQVQLHRRNSGALGRRFHDIRPPMTSAPQCGASAHLSSNTLCNI